MKGFFRRNRIAFLLSLLYFIPGMLWVFFADSFIFESPVSSEAKRIQQLDLVKDASFVAAMSVFIFFLLLLSRKKLRNVRFQYENIFNNHPQPLWIYEIETLRFKAVNEAAIRQYGYTREEFLSFTLKDIRPVEDVPLLEDYVAMYQPGLNRNSIWNHRKKNGETIIVEIISSDVEFFRVPCRMVCINDITGRVKSESDIKRLSLVAENATNSIIILDKYSHIEWVNAAFTRLTGYSFSEVIGKRPSEFLHGPETDKTALDDIMRNVQSGKPFAGEILNYRKDGTKFWIRLTVSPVLANGVIINYVTIQTDITAIKDQNSRLRDIAYTASHGFRKPLANILGLVNVFDESQNNTEIIENLKKSAEELDTQVKVIVEKTAMIEP